MDVVNIVAKPMLVVGQKVRWKGANPPCEVVIISLYKDGRVRIELPLEKLANATTWKLVENSELEAISGGETHA
jgi:hypothetical protein